MKRALYILAAVIIVIAILAATSAVVIGIRRFERSSGVNAVTAPTVEASHRSGEIEAKLDYWALFSGEDHQVSSDIVWNDDWFFDDPYEYNHELAHTAAVLSVVANAESTYYQRGSSSPAYAEDAFEKLGFESVSTSSYTYRSEIIDEVIGALDGTDVVAYTLATKRIRSSETGREKLLTVVVIRGSYGTEWLSNAKIEESDDSVSDEVDHLGFTLAAREIVEDLEARADAADDGLERSYLFCGHSRGGAVANLLASYVDGEPRKYDAIASANDVMAYTFAAPNCTSDDNARDERYGNIFNVVNPSDIVTRLPLSSWGYSRYGRDILLPSDDSETYDSRVDAMRSAYEDAMGTEYPDDEENEETVERIVETVSESFDSFDELISPAGIVTLVPLLVQSDLPQLLVSHYPNTYIAWLEATDAGDLAFG